MSKKCFATIILYTLFLAFMLGTAYALAFFQLDSVVIKVVIIAALMIVCTILALTTEKCSFITIIIGATLWGTALSFLFDYLGCPSPTYMFYAALATVAWLTLFCFFTNLPFVKQNHKVSMIIWAVVLAVAGVGVALFTQDELGWTSLALIAPFIMFFAALPVCAENLAEHSHHIAIYSIIPALLIVRLLLFLRVPVGSFEAEDLFPQADDDYVFVYCPTDDDVTEE